MDYIGYKFNSVQVYSDRSPNEFHKTEAAVTHTFLGVSSMEQTMTYFQVVMHRIALLVFSLVRG